MTTGLGLSYMEVLDHSGASAAIQHVNRVKYIAPCEALVDLGGLRFHDFLKEIKLSTWIADNIMRLSVTRKVAGEDRMAETD